VTCRQCGTEIADKALICYRCGTATTEAKFKPAASKTRVLPLVATFVAVVLLVAFTLFVGRTDAGDAPRFFSWAVAAIAVVIVALRAYARRR
jgi:uncharacterized membrane protein YvbJ